MQAYEHYLSRWSGAGLLDQARSALADGGPARFEPVAADIAALVAPELGWDEAEAARQADDFRALANAERAAAGLSETVLA